MTEERTDAVEEEPAEAEAETESETEDRDPTPEDRDPTPEDRDPKTEDRDPKTEDRDPKTEDRDPKTEDRDPKTETPKTETPKTETPKTETPKSETPKSETPKTETPKTETPKTEAPKPETPTPESAFSNEPDLGTRLVGLAWFLVCAAALVVLVRRVFELEFGTTNPRILYVIRGAAVVVPGYPALLGLWTLITGRRPPLRVNPLDLPLEGWWYGTLGTLTLRELKRVFLHPVAYIVLFVFLAVNGYLFWQLLNVYAGTRYANLPEPATFHISTTLFTWISLILICPALTMRLLAEEEQGGTLEMLMTAPVSDIQIVVSKYISAVIYFVFMVATAHIAYTAVLQPYTPDWDWGPPVGAFVGQALIGSAFLALGLFTSSVTKNQILAYLLAALALVTLVFAPQIAAGSLKGTEADWVRPLIGHVSVVEHQRSFARGIIHWKTLVFYASTSCYFVFLAVRGVESHRWR